MQLLIDSTKLEALLQRKQDYIGYKKLDQSCNVANALFVMYGGFSASPETSLWAKVIVIIVGGFGLYWSGCAMVKAIKNTYNADLLQLSILFRLSLLKIHLINILTVICFIMIIDGG